MKDLTFREVIANIKEGEVWENTKKCFVLEAIKKEDEIIKLDFRDKRTSFGIDGLFRLQRQKVSFQEAFEALAEGKEIESCLSGRVYKQDENSDIEVSLNSRKGSTRYLPSERLLTIGECASEWYIN